ncbi:MAG: aminopeptidase P family protein, partial [Cyanobacteria bacterium P01_H01_bin.15]
PKDLEQETWHGYRLGVDAAQAHLGADAVFSITELESKLSGYVATADRLYYGFGRDHTFNEFIIRLWQSLLRSYSKRGAGPDAIADPGFLLHPQRRIKSEAELALIRKATGLSVAAHQRAQSFAKPGVYEFQVQAEIEHLFRLNGGEGPAYPSIVASGPNACVLHYTENNRQLAVGDLLLIDAGCSYGYYNGDITRTFPIGGERNPEQQAIYDIVLAAQRQAIAEVQSGKPFKNYHDTAVCVIVQGLMDLGLLVGDFEQIIKEEKYKPFYMHRTGHWLGLDVHDTGIYNREDLLEPNQLLTVEPGIYISPHIKLADDQPDVPAHWRGIGIRIEDDVLVTATGNEVLTAALAK